MVDVIAATTLVDIYATCETIENEDELSQVGMYEPTLVEFMQVLEACYIILH